MRSVLFSALLLSSPVFSQENRGNVLVVSTPELSNSGTNDHSRQIRLQANDNLVIEQQTNIAANRGFGNPSVNDNNQNVQSRDRGGSVVQQQMERDRGGNIVQQQIQNNRGGNIIQTKTQAVERSQQSFVSADNSREKSVNVNFRSGSNRIEFPSVETEQNFELSTKKSKANSVSRKRKSNCGYSQKGRVKKENLKSGKRNSGRKNLRCYTF